MAQTRSKKNQPATTGSRTHDGGAIPILRVKKGASLKEIYAAARRAFTAADLQKYAEIEEGVPMRRVLAELEVIDREERKKRLSKSKIGRSK
jgi:hypothetical protein